MGSIPSAGSKGTMKRKKRQAIPHYTYRKSSEEVGKKLYKKISFVLILTTVTAAVVWFWGTSFINLLGILAKPEEPVQIQTNLNLPISKPILDPLPDSTNKERIDISGRTSSDQKVTLIASGITLNTISKSNGTFSFEGIQLEKGLNLIKVYVLDSSENKLEESFVITFDNKPPILSILSPKDGQSFPSKTKSIEVTGNTESKAVVFINDLQAVVNPNGKFTFNYPVKKGTTKIEIKATDKAGNEKKLSVTIIISD